MNKPLVLKQTDGGMYNSCPSVEDCEKILAAKEQWQEWDVLGPYIDRGHGEYASNVHAVVDECRRSGSSPEDILALAQWE